MPAEPLRVQLEILHAPVVQDDDLDVLPANVNDDVRIFIELQRRLRVGHGFNQRHIRLENVFENVFRVAGRRNTQHFEFCVLAFDLPAPTLEHIDRVLDRIAVRELVRLAEDRAVFIEENRFCGSRSTVDSDEAAHRGAQKTGADGKLGK